jgi:broad specificity polyphosphatase/5'/3'-nucleotidase SurE
LRETGRASPLLIRLNLKKAQSITKIKVTKESEREVEKRRERKTTIRAESYYTH